MSNALREQLRQHLLPWLETRGFVADQPQNALFWTYRREVGEQLQILEVQWDKYRRPRFILNYGTCPRQGLVIDGRNISGHEMAAGWTEDAGRAHAGTSAEEHWFRQDRPWWRRLFGGAPLVDAQPILHGLQICLHELDIYWASGLLGPHMWPLARPERAALKTPAGDADSRPTPHR
ncbi:hypothetical protein [Pseudomonas sp. ML96]|uniref:hypothetical protein n=1 Tax=Pseudomonas sp. ML96 TaxID=1523503 RepID=UPI0005B7CFE0|nr:hypothetical protein [Pseudomonas sp. ML96]